MFLTMVGTLQIVQALLRSQLWLTLGMLHFKIQTPVGNKTHQCFSFAHLLQKIAIFYDNSISKTTNLTLSLPRVSRTKSQEISQISF